MDESGAQNSAGGVTDAGANVPTAQVNLVPERKRGRRKKGLIFAVVGVLAVVLVGVITALAVVRPWEDNEVAEVVEMTETEIALAEYLAKIGQEAAELREELMMVEDSDEEGGVYVLNLDDVDTATGETYRNIIISETIGIYNGYISETEGEVRLGLLTVQLNYILENDINKLYGCQAVNAAKAIDEIEQTTSSARQVISVAVAYEYNEDVDEYTGILYQRQVEDGLDLEMETMG